MKTITPSEFRALFEGSEEFAPIDTREEGVFARAHLLAASNLPLSRLDMTVASRIPNRSTTIVLCETDSAQRSQAILHQLGYDNVVVLAGGIAGWALDGGKLFSGVNVIGKAFGEFVEKFKHTPSIDAPALRELLTGANPPLLLDTRTPHEHQSFCIPGALSCPNGELVYRALHTAQNDEQVIVTHCAGRTRSIIGAQTLIDAGVPNPVLALENGTLAWIFEDYPLEHGANRPLPLPGNTASARARSAVDAMIEPYSVTDVDVETVSAWAAESNSTTYLIDVRSPEEQAKGRFLDAQQVPGGQLVQNIDRYLVTRNARVVLVDTDGVRAKASAAWLAQLGWRNVHVLSIPSEQLTPARVAAAAPASELTCPQALRLIEADNALLVDCRTSVAYRDGHPAGAHFLTRANLDTDTDELSRRQPVVVFGDDPDYVSALAGDLRARQFAAKTLVASLNEWQSAGGSTQTGVESLLSAPEDVFFDAGDFDDVAILKREGRAYLEWEIGLVHQLDNDPGAPYLKQGNSS